MSDDSVSPGTRYAVAFLLLGVLAFVAGVTYLGGWLSTALGLVMTVGGAGSLLAFRLGWSQRESGVPMVLAGFAIGGLLVWYGYQRGTVFLPIIGVGMAVALVLLWRFPTRQEFSWTAATVTFGGAGLWLLSHGTPTVGLVLAISGIVFARESYQNWPTAEN